MENKKYNLYTGKEIILQALNNEGTLAKCYKTFTSYSILNTVALMAQLSARKMEIAPVASFKKWSALGGKIKKGSKALFVNIPKIYKENFINEETNEEETRQVLTGYFWRACVFSLTQVEGINASTLPENCKNWNYKKALETLKIHLLPFNEINGNVQGYATPEGIALNPVAEHSTRTLCHEIAHYILHFKESAKNMAREIKEAEAEMVSYLVGAFLGIAGDADSRGYIHHWLGQNEFTDKNCLRVIATANKILKAGEC